MSESTYWTILIVANVPAYLVIGWLIFDTGDAAVDSLVAAVKALVRAALIGWFRWRDDVWELINYAIFLAVCAAVVTAEHWILVRYGLAPASVLPDQTVLRLAASVFA